MKPELLQPLLLDRALGELSPEVAALLDEHLARDPQAARHAAELDHTLVAARAITRLDAVAPVPALDSARLHQLAQSDRAAARRSQWFRLAACLALGGAAGWLARPLSAPPASAPALADIIPARPPVATSAGLWSRSRIVAEHASDRSSVRPSASRPPAHSPFAPASFREEKL